MRNTIEREPVLTAAVIAGLAMAVSLGWLSINSEQLGSIEGFLKVLEPLLALIIPIAAAWIARQKVTPVNSPRTHDGQDAIIIAKVSHES